MAQLQRGAAAQSLYWVLDDKGEKIGRIWGLDGYWRWSLRGADSRDAASLEAAAAVALAAASQTPHPARPH